MYIIYDVYIIEYIIHIYYIHIQYILSIFSSILHQLDYR